MYRVSFALLAAFAVAAPATAQSLAGLFDARSHDFGNVPIGPTLNHSFTIKNTTTKGDAATLKITRALGDDVQTAEISFVKENGEWKMRP